METVCRVQYISYTHRPRDAPQKKLNPTVDIVIIPGTFGNMK